MLKDELLDDLKCLMEKQTKLTEDIAKLIRIISIESKYMNKPKPQ